MTLIIPLINSKKINNLEYIDRHFFLNKICFEDREMCELLKETLQESDKYASSIVVYDLDSIADIQLSFANLVEELPIAHEDAFKKVGQSKSFSYQLHHLQTFRNALTSMEIQPEAGHWRFIFTNNNKLGLDFTKKSNWPMTNRTEKKAAKIREETKYV